MGTTTSQDDITTAVLELVETLTAKGIEVLHADDNLLFVKDVNGKWYGVRFN